MKTVQLFLISLFLVFISCGDKKEKKEEIPPAIVEEAVTVAPDVIVEKPMIFSVQIGAFSKENKLFAAISNIEISTENGMFVYRLGSFETYKEARDSRRKLRNTYPGAFVQALKNGNRIEIKNALKTN